MRKCIAASLAALAIGLTALTGCGGGGESHTSDEDKNAFVKAVAAQGIVPFEPGPSDTHLVMSVDKFLTGNKPVTDENVNDAREMQCWVTLGWYGGDYYVIDAQDGRQVVRLYAFEKGASSEKLDDAKTSATPETLIEASKSKPSPDMRQIMMLVETQYRQQIPEGDQVSNFC